MKNQATRITLGLILLAVASVATPQTNSGSLGLFDITAYERKETFAGRLGNRVNEKLTLSQNGKTYTLSFGAFHTRIAGQTVKPFCPGCRVEVKKGKFAKDTIVAERKDVVQLHDKESKGHRAGSE
jgi:hypothetical protein